MVKEKGDLMNSAVGSDGGYEVHTAVATTEDAVRLLDAWQSLSCILLYCDCHRFLKAWDIVKSAKVKLKFLTEKYSSH